MRKGGAFALIVYILYTLFFGGIFVFVLNGVLNGEAGIGGIGVFLGNMIIGGFAVSGLVAIILKVIHMATGWIVFGILCVLIDINAVYTLVASIISVGAITAVTLVLILPLALAIGALVSNIKSLKN